MLSAKDLFKYRGGLDKAMPAKGGEKAFMPDGSWLQEKCIESYNKERERVLSEPRVVRSMDIAKGEWKPEVRLLELIHEMKNFFEHMGFNDNKRKWLYPEEALFLLETGALEIWYSGLPLSIQEAYSILIDDKIQLDYYQVYSHLRRIGYVVLRHQGRYNFSKYERKIGLDKHVSRKMKRKGEKGDEKARDQSGGTRSQGENLTKSTNLEETGDKTVELSVSVCNQNRKQSKSKTYENQSEYESNKVEEHFDDNVECEDSNASCKNDNIYLKESTTSSINLDESSQSSIQSQEGLCNQMLEKKTVTAKQTMQSRSNFEDIEFPNFKSTGDRVLIPCPNVKYIPQGSDVSFNDCVYSFEKKLYINTKKMNRKQQMLDEALVQKLDFSYPEIMTGWYKVKKSCTNWQQYKAALKKEKSMRNRSKLFPHMYEDKVKPLIKPENSTSTSAVLDQLSVVKDDEVKKCDIVPDSLPEFDVYAPNSKFKKSKPGIPDFRVKVVRPSDPVPDLKDVNAICSYLNDEALLHWAVVDCGNILYHNIANLPLPRDISLG